MEAERASVDFIVVDEVDLYSLGNPLRFNKALGETTLIGVTGTVADGTNSEDPETTVE